MDFWEWKVDRLFTSETQVRSPGYKVACETTQQGPSGKFYANPRTLLLKPVTESQQHSGMKP